MYLQRFETMLITVGTIKGLLGGSEGQIISLG